MKDFARLAVGMLLLGLAIYLSLNFEEGPSTSSNPSEDSPESQTEMTQPEWQSPDSSGTWLASQDRDDSFVRPEIDTSPNIYARPLPTATGFQSPMNDPPQISDQYQPSRPLVVSGQIRRESGLVPVQPRPSFTGTISVVRQIHTVRESDSLQSIAREYFGNTDRYLDIYLLNKDVLSNPARLPAGVEIRIPGN